MLAIEYYVHIWQVLPQLSCDDASQIWMWYKDSNRYFGRIENLAYGEINEPSFSNPHPWAVVHWSVVKVSVAQCKIVAPPVCSNGDAAVLH